MATEESRSVARRYFEEFHNSRRDDLLGALVAPDLVEPMRRATDALRRAFPDYRITLTAQVTEGDRVATVWTLQGTHRGEWASPAGPVAPTGRAVAFTGTTTLRVAGGQIAEVLGTNWDHLGILQQLDALPGAARRPGA